jgi:hypothetical protein
MYSPRLVLEKLSRFTAKYGWTPVEHSIEEIDKVNEWMKSLYTTDKKGDLIFDDAQLTAPLKKWIANERAMCAISFEYYLTRYHFISAENRIFRFKFRGGQKVLFQVIQELEDRGVSIEILLLKARQGGFSTFVEALMTHRALFVPGVKCTIGSANDQKTYVMMGMMYTALENLPWWLPPQQTKDKRSGAALLEFAHVGSQIVIQSGSIRGGIGQGTTPTAIHLSEVCDYSDPLTQIEEGLFKAVHSGPEILMILESTGNGNTGWWAEQWRDNKEFYFQGRARLYPLFIPWFMTPELYPKKEWIDKFKIPPKWTPNPSTLMTIAKCEAYAHSSEALTRVIGKGWKMSREQQWFWEFNYEDAKRRRTEKSWLRHMPCDDYDALIGENDSVFDQDSIENIRKNRSKTVEVFGIIGEGIAEKHDPIPEAVDYQKERLLVSWKTMHEIRLEWVLMPLVGDPESAAFDSLKKLLIYEHPQPDALYSIGIDTGFGVGGDRTAIIVNRNGMDAVPDVQVAEFAADDITNVEVYAWAMAIAAYYSQFMEDGATPRFVIEQRRKYGDSCYHALKLHGFKNHHHFREYDKRTLRPTPSVNAREGWWTNEWSRPLLLGTFKHAVENGWYEINSRFTLGEIEALEQIISTSGKIKQDHRSGEHDDRIFAAAMAYFTFHDNDLMAERSKKKYSKPSDDGWDIDYRPWTLSVPNPGAEEFFEQFSER